MSLSTLKINPHIKYHPTNLKFIVCIKFRQSTWSNPFAKINIEGQFISFTPQRKQNHHCLSSAWSTNHNILKWDSLGTIILLYNYQKIWVSFYDFKQYIKYPSVTIKHYYCIPYFDLFLIYFKHMMRLMMRQLIWFILKWNSRASPTEITAPRDTKVSLDCILSISPALEWL